MDYGYVDHPLDCTEQLSKLACSLLGCFFLLEHPLAPAVCNAFAGSPETFSKACSSRTGLSLQGTSLGSLPLPTPGINYPCG